MKFYNETTRLQHPSVGLIPLSIWRDYFSDRYLPLALSDLMLMSKLETFDTIADKAIKLSNDRKTNIKIWLGISIAFSPSVSELITFGNMLDLDSRDCLVLATSLGNIEFVEEFLKSEGGKDHLLNLNSLDEYELFNKAVIHGHLDLIKLFTRYLTPQDLKNIISQNSYEIFEMATSYYTPIVFNWLLAQLPDAQAKQTMITSYGGYDAIIEASAKNNLVALKLLTACFYDYALRSDFLSGGSVFSFAVGTGNMEIINLLFEMVPSRRKRAKMVSYFDYKAFGIAAGWGHLELLDWYLSLFKTKKMKKTVLFSNRNAAIIFSIRNGNIECIRRLMEFARAKKIKDKLVYQSFYIDAVIEAVDYGEIEIFEFLMQFISSSAQLKLFNRYKHILFIEMDDRNRMYVPPPENFDNAKIKVADWILNILDRKADKNKFDELRTYLLSAKKRIPINRVVNFK